jgi:hypothetical protein
MGKRNSEEKSDKTLERAEMIRQEAVEAGGDIEFPDRNTKDGIAERREHVAKFMSRRVPQTVMSELLGVSRRTIYEDVQWWKERSKEHIQRIQDDPDYAATDIGLAAMRMEGIAQAALQDYELAHTGPLKNLCLNTALKAEKTRADMLMLAGVWPKAGEDIRVAHTIEATFTAKLGSVGEDSPLRVLDQPASRRKVMSAAELILKLAAERQNKKQLPTSAGQVIDVPAAPKDPS